MGLSVTAVLFAGPLAYEAQEAADRARNGLRPWVRMRTTLQVLRDCVVAPVTEELVFRASLPAFLRAACPPLGAAAAAAAALLVFASAHCHHVFERLRHGGHSLRTALGATAFQALYTGVFGAYGSLLLHSTRSVAAPIAAHVLCNAQGVPPFASMRRHRRAALLMTVTGLGAAALARPRGQAGLRGGRARRPVNAYSLKFPAAPVRHVCVGYTLEFERVPEIEMAVPCYCLILICFLLRQCTAALTEGHIFLFLAVSQ